MGTQAPARVSAGHRRWHRPPPPAPLIAACIARLLSSGTARTPARYSYAAVRVCSGHCPSSLTSFCFFLRAARARTAARSFSLVWSCLLLLPTAARAFVLWREAALVGSRAAACARSGCGAATGCSLVSLLLSLPWDRAAAFHITVRSACFAVVILYIYTQNQARHKAYMINISVCVLIRSHTLPTSRTTRIPR